MVPPPSTVKRMAGVTAAVATMNCPVPAEATLVTWTVVFVPELNVMPVAAEEELAMTRVPPETVVTPV